MPNEKVIVYVKHYLTPNGITYFQQEWFPWVHSILAQQPGFVSICHNIKGLCANISLQFEDSTTFEARLAHPSHDSLVAALDDHRDRNYWEAARTDNEQAEPSELQWTEIKPRKNGLNPKEKEFGDIWESTRTRSGKPLQEYTATSFFGHGFGVCYTPPIQKENLWEPVQTKVRQNSSDGLDF